MSEDSPQSHHSPDRVHKPNGSISGPSGSGSGGANPRSCVTCRRRKVKCDKKQPCSNCVRAKIECIFPGPGRAPRKSRKPPDAELLERLRRLEGVVSSLNAQVEEHEQEAAERERRGSTGEPSGCPYGSDKANPNGNAIPSVAVDDTVEGLENRFGRLVVEKGRSRYINNSFWASLNNEVEDLRAILIEPSDDEDVHSPDTSQNSSSQHQGFVFGYSSTSVDMQSLHPMEQQARQFWAIFKENVDPLVKVLHIPTFEPVFIDAVGHTEKIGKGLEALLFAIYYGAVTSTTPEECLERWGETRLTLLDRYRFGLEQGLARANFLYCDETVVLQAFIIFLILLRRNDDARKIWTLTGLVVRIAQTLGVHRDGSHFKLPPFEIEMRRRLWWQVCILDARSSEDHGCDPTIVEAQFDTKMPLNVNDSDLHPDMTDFPEERQGFTDMTFCLLRFEVANIFRRMLYVPPGPDRCNVFFAGLTIEQKEKWITECHQRMEEKYLANMDMTVPLCWVTATISRLIMSKMWLIVYHPHQRKDGGATLPQETKDKLFITSLENIEYSMLLETEARTMKWGWLFRTYVQWHAIAFLLSELCVRTKGEAVERAWRALEATAGRWWFPLNNSSAHRKGQQGCLWKPLRKLLAKAKAARERELALERASMAIRNGQMMYPGYSLHDDRLSVGSLTMDQPSSENLDRMLRPAAPKLGDSTSGSQSSWPSSPAVSNGKGTVPRRLADITPAMQQSNSAAMNASPIGQPNPADTFADLTRYGLDSILGDVMHGIAVSGQPISADYTHPLPDGVAAVNANIPQSAQLNQQNTSPTAANSAATAINGAHGTFGDHVFANMDFGDMNPALGDGLEGVPNDSPILDGGNMDWTIWDDLVNQYGLDGQQVIPNGNPAAHAGLAQWF
ncbi:fungal-specific transcription factor domain-containing protein [Paraphoma chrysanthemicola]|uniref:Fungal-specific transcription factor domain-containing protein n=1 Tax=Paraphoma chrysanthemicola TaxID=798071 RepID=A0A8K0VRB0_9PLEO|nr:fungal-specific transcription factor domain-containing protein [Paraphoma chrysanthemicola]